MSKKLMNNLKSKIQKMQAKKGFTLVEIMSVVALIAILFVILVPRLDFANNKVRESGLQSDFRSYQLALEQVARQHSGFDTFTKDVENDAGGTDTVTDQAAIITSINSYLDAALQITYVSDGKFTIDMEDPWSDAYRFLYCDEHNACYVVSDGPDKEADESTLLKDVEAMFGRSDGAADAEAEATAAATALDNVNDKNTDLYALGVSYAGSETGLSIQTVGFDSNIDR
jgi:prepilin-type N-terminal cleavage/methylation domain-containing protein